MRALPAVILAVLLVLAGCSGGPTTTETPATSDGATPTPEPAQSVTVEGGALSVDATTVFGRVQSLLGSDVAPPATVTLADDERLAETFPTGAVGVLGGVDTDRLLAGFDVAGRTTSGDDVFLNLALLDEPAALESTLAHEYVHAIQYRTGDFPSVLASLRGDTPGVLDVDGLLADRAVLEGAAVAGEQGYWTAHVGVGTPPVERTERRYDRQRGLGSIAAALYRDGYRYVDERVDGPSGLTRVDDRLPATTTAVLHDRKPGSVESVPLAVDASADTWTARGVRAELGELVTREFLRLELGNEAAAAAAAGWGADRLRVFERDGQRSFVWVVRFHSEGEAEEFAGATTRWLDARAERQGGAWVGDRTYQLRRPDGRTVALLAGGPSFARNTRVSGNVTVRAP